LVLLLLLLLLLRVQGSVLSRQGQVLFAYVSNAAALGKVLLWRQQAPAVKC
jgi:hypothetical protein